MKRRSIVSLVVVAGLAVLPVQAFAAGASALGDTARVASFAPRIPSGATRLGAVPATRALTIDVVLQSQHSAELASLLESLYDPTSPRYGQWLTPDEFAREFGPSDAEVASVTAWLHAKGLSNTRVEGSAVQATGTASAVAAAFRVSFSRYRLAQGSFGYATSSAPLIPRALTGGIAAIVGLSDTVHFANQLDVSPHRSTSATANAAAVSHAAAKACNSARAFAAGGFWTPDQVAAHYGVNNLLHSGMDGHGVKIALVELGPSRPADTNAYLACFGLHNKVTAVKVDGGAPADPTGTLQAESDIQEAATNAPGAAIVSYEGPNSLSGKYDLFNRIVHDNVPIVSTGWVTCEAALQSSSPGYMGSLHQLFQQAAAQGQTVFAASGDQGSEGCYDLTTTPPSETLQVDSPANDPLVTGVGGTLFEAANVEPVWNDCEQTSGDGCAASGGLAGGGGQSTFFSRPAWQPRAPGSTCSSCRQVPDVSANAGVGEVFYDSDAAGPGHWIAAGGTSIAAPKWAGMAADIATACVQGRMGNLAPKLSALAAKRVYGAAFTDVTTGLDRSGPNLVTPGDNDLTRTHLRAYKTATGFDMASGIGTPLAGGLACPQITSLSDTSAAPEAHVTVRGTDLANATIKFGAATAKVLSANSYSATVVVPSGSGSGAVKVSASNPIGTGTGRASFSYLAVDTGYRTFASDGGVFDFGAAQFSGSPAGSTTAPIVGAAADAVTGGYWLAGSDGNVYNFNAPALGSLDGAPLNQPIVGIAATKNGAGYWLVARDGGVFSFGSARFLGSMGGVRLNQPIVGIAATMSGDGYWLVARDGGVFAFGSARFLGSMGGVRLNQPIVGIAADAVSGGYRLVARDGGVFAFGAPFRGSTGGVRLNKPIVGIATASNTGGYWLVASDGGVFAFDAPFDGSTGGEVLNKPMVAIAS